MKERTKLGENISSILLLMKEVMKEALLLMKHLTKDSVRQLYKLQAEAIRKLLKEAKGSAAANGGTNERS